MLLNKSNVSVVVKYGGIEKVIEPGERVDVRDFDISVGQNLPIKTLVPLVEKRFIKKYPGCFDIVETVDDVKIADEYKGEIDALKSQIATKDKEIASLRATNDQNARKIAQQGEEINGFGAKEAGYKREIEALKTRLKEQDEDNESVLKRVRGGR